MFLRPAIRADADAIAYVHVQAWRETYRGVIPDSTLDALSVEERAKAWRERLGAMGDRQHSVVAIDGAGALVGMAGCGPTRLRELGTDGEIYMINIVNAGKRKRAGTRMMLALADYMISQRFKAVGLWVVEKNTTARAFYERLGGRAVAQHEQDFDGTAVMELGYAWAAIADLKQAAQRLLEAP